MDTTSDKLKSLGWGYDAAVERHILAELLLVYGYDPAEAEAIRSDAPLSPLSAVRLAFMAQRINVWCIHQGQKQRQLGAVMLLIDDTKLRFIPREIYLPEASIRAMQIPEGPSTAFVYNIVRVFNPLNGDVPCAVYPIDLDHWAFSVMGIDEYPASSNIYPTKEAAIEAGSAFLRRKIAAGWRPGGIDGEPTSAFDLLPLEKVERIFAASYEQVREIQADNEARRGQPPPPPPVGFVGRHPPTLDELDDRLAEEEMPDGEDDVDEPPPTAAELRPMIRGAIRHLLDARTQANPPTWTRFGFNENDAITRMDVCREVLDIMPLLQDLVRWCQDHDHAIPTIEEYPDFMADANVLGMLMEPRDPGWEVLFQGPLTDEATQQAEPYREDPPVHPYQLADRLVFYRTSLDDRLLRRMVLTTYP